MAKKRTDMLDGLQAAIIANAKKENKEKNIKYKFDPLKMYFREDYFVKGIRIVQPTINDIIAIGESNFYLGLSPFLYNSTTIRVELWDLPERVDWCQVKDIEVFGFLKTIFQVNDLAVRLIFPDYRIENMQLQQYQDSNSDDIKLCLYDFENDFYLTEFEYMEIAEYLRELLDYHPRIEKAKGQITKQWMIDEEKMNAVQKKNKESSFSLLPLMSACINHPGFKYKSQELKDIGIYEFKDSVQRLQVYESTRALLSGSYSGFCDTSNVPKDQFNFMRELKNEI